VRSAKYERVFIGYLFRGEFENECSFGLATFCIGTAVRR